MQRVIKGTKRLPRLLSFRVTGTGTAAINEGNYDGVLVDNGTGDWTITFAIPFLRAPVVAVSVLTSVSIHQIAAVSASAVQIKGFSATDGTTAKDIVFHMMVLGWDTADQT